MSTSYPRRTKSLTQNSSKSTNNTQGPTYVILKQEVSIFTFVVRLWWFLMSLLPVTALVLLTYTFWIIKDNIVIISESLQKNSVNVLK